MGVKSALAALVIVCTVGVSYWFIKAQVFTPCDDTNDRGFVAWEVETLVDGLQIPWAIAPSRDGKIFFTERSGRLNVIDKAGSGSHRILATLPVAHVDDDLTFTIGLQGLALHPDYPTEPYLYLYYTYGDEGRLFNRLVRFKDLGDRAVEDHVLLDQIPGSPWQNGGRVRFGPDGKLYLSTGGARGGPRVDSTAGKILRNVRDLTTSRGEAQDPASLIGKILRMNRDGTLPQDNPFGESFVYTYGHRNTQGLAWHPVTQRLYNTEHGPPGGWDEINLIEPGQNYGWPRFKGYTGYIKLTLPVFRPRYTRPFMVYTPAIAPAGASFYRGNVFPQWKNSLFVAALGARHLRRIELNAEGTRIKCEEKLLDTTYGRLRDIIEGPNGFLYVSTSNYRPDTPGSDDRILRIVPKK